MTRQFGKSDRLFRIVALEFMHQRQFLRIRATAERHSLGEAAGHRHVRCSYTVILNEGRLKCSSNNNQESQKDGNFSFLVQNIEFSTTGERNEGSR
jgi:hypothetical protein